MTTRAHHDGQRAALLRHVAPLVVHRPADVVEQSRLPEHGHAVCLKGREVRERRDRVKPRRLGHVQSGPGRGARREL